MSARTLLTGLGLATLGSLVAAMPALASCTISTTSVSFGSYNVFATSPTDSTGSVSYNCFLSLGNITIFLNKGSASSFNPRRMLRGSEALNYNLYRDAARTTIWGDGTGGTQVFTATIVVSGSATVTIYGRIPAGQDVSVGSYTDSITATINF